MNTRRQAARVTARTLAVGAATAMLGAVVMTAAVPSTASAAPAARTIQAARTTQARQVWWPLYRCEFVHEEQGRFQITGNRCWTPNGPRRGFVSRLTLVGRFGGRFACEFGYAELPQRVNAYNCQPIFD